MQKTLLLSSALLLLYSISGCEGGLLFDMEPGTSYDIIVNPGKTVQLGYLEQKQFHIQLVDHHANPVSGETIEISIIGAAHNAKISADTVDTDPDGQAHITLTAPDRQSSFTVRFVIPRLGESASVDVEVLPQLLSLTVELARKGARVANSYEGALYENRSCSEIIETEQEEPFQTQSVEQVPGKIQFSGLRFSHTYAVFIRGLNEYGETRISGCRDEISPGEKNVVLVLSDTLLDIAGRYAVATEIKSKGALNEAARVLFEALYGSPIYKSTEKAILDKIRSLVVEAEPFAGEAYDEVREKNGLDPYLSQDLKQRQIAIQASFEEIEEDVIAYLQTALLESEFDIASPVAEVYTVSHRLRRLTFANGENTITLGNQLFPETMTTEAYFKGGGKDTLLIGYHAFNFGLATALDTIFQSAISAAFSANTLSGSLVSLIDCEKTADILLPKLAEVTSRAVVLNGCLEAARDAESVYKNALDLLVLYYRPMALQGACLIHDPGEINHIDGFAGLFVIKWKNLTSEPIECPFMGKLVK